MTKNVTLRLDEDLIRELRHQAVDSNQSLSAWIATVLQRESKDTGPFDRARTRALRRLHRGFQLGGKPLSREEAHAR